MTDPNLDSSAFYTSLANKSVTAANIFQADHYGASQPVQRVAVQSCAVKAVQSGASQAGQIGSGQAVQVGAGQEVKSDEAQSGAVQNAQRGVDQAVMMVASQADGQASSLIINDRRSSSCWEIQRFPKRIYPKKDFQILLSNRFSSLDNAVEDFHGKEMHCLSKRLDVKEIFQVYQKKSQTLSVKKGEKLGLRSFKTEKNIENILRDEKFLKHEKRKCTSCNYKKRCYVNPVMCSAKDKNCTKCMKPNHFPQSKQCLKTRNGKFKAKMEEQKLKSGCQNLRDYRKNQNDCPKTEITGSENKKLHPESARGMKIQSFDLRKIRLYVRILEQKLKLKHKFENLSYNSKCFLLIYLFSNVEIFSIKNNYNMQENSPNEDIHEIQNLVTLIKENKPETNLVETEKISSENLKREIENSQKLIQKYITNLESLNKMEKNGKLNCMKISELDEEEEINLESISEVPELLRSDNGIRLCDMNTSDIEECSIRKETTDDEVIGDDMEDHNIQFENESLYHLESSNCSINRLQTDRGLYLLPTSSSDDSYDMEDDNQESKYSIDQLDGALDKSRKEIFNGLAGLASHSFSITLLINLFRGLENYWGFFSKHVLCRTPHCKSGRRCLFCHLRSIALRSNRVKRKISIKTMEMDSQLDYLPDEVSFINDFPKVVSKMLEDISSFDLEFRNQFLGSNLNCDSCTSRFSVGLFDTIHIEDNYDMENVQDIATSIEDKIAKIHQVTNQKCKNLT